MLVEPISMPASEEGQIAELHRLLNLGVPALISPGDERLELPYSVYRLLRDIVKNMQQGRAVTLVPEQGSLTTQKAADYWACHGRTSSNFSIPARSLFIRREATAVFA